MCANFLKGEIMTTFNTKMDFHGSYDAAIAMLTVTKEQYGLIKKAQKDIANSKIIDEAILRSNVMSHEDLREYNGKKDISDIELSNLQAFEFKLEEMEVKLYKNELHAYFKYSDDDDTLYAAKSISIKELDNFFNPENSELVEKDEEIENLAFENKNMALALSDLGFTQEQIGVICNGSFGVLRAWIDVENSIEGTDYVLNVVIRDMVSGKYLSEAHEYHLNSEYGANEFIKKINNSKLLTLNDAISIHDEIKNEEIQF